MNRDQAIDLVRDLLDDLLAYAEERNDKELANYLLFLAHHYSWQFGGDVANLWGPSSSHTDRFGKLGLVTFVWDRGKEKWQPVTAFPQGRPWEEGWRTWGPPEASP